MHPGRGACGLRVCRTEPGRGGEEREQVGHAGARAVGRRAEFLGGRARAVEPERRVAEPGGARDVPRVRRHEHDAARVRAERGGAERIRGRARLVRAHGVGRQHAIEQAGHARALDRDVEHLRGAVRQDRERRARVERVQLAQRGHRVGIGGQARVFVHQAFLGRTVQREPEPARGEPQRVERDVPKRAIVRAGRIGERAQLRVFDLLAPPQLRQPFPVSGKHLLSRGQHGTHVEQRAECVEEDGVGGGECRCGRHSLALQFQRSGRFYS